MSLRALLQAGYSRAVHAAFPLLQRAGLHITRNHFYEPVPDTRTLAPELWQRHASLTGVDMNEAAQLALLDRFAADYRAEYAAFPRAPQPDGSFHLGNGAFEAVDAEVLWCLVRSLRPRRVLEIGSGFSTRLTAQALLRNERDGAPPAELVACEPYPGEALRRGFAGLTRLIEQPVQHIAPHEFERLAAGDILFIDSSHVVKIGSDVLFEMLEMLPRLQPGVTVHIHDIFLPAEYPRAWVLEQRRFWSEQYLLHAFLLFNRAFEVVWGGSYMHLRHPDRLAAAFPSYDAERAWPGSFWIRRVS